MDGVAMDIFILSALRKGPVHGYELKRRVQRPTLKRLSNNSIYPALRRFLAAGALTQTVEEQDGRPDRKIYAITDHGLRLFRESVSSLPAELAADEEEFLVRLSFFDEIGPADRRGILAARAAALEAKAAQVEALLAGRRSAGGPAPEHAGRPDWPSRAMDQFLSQLRQELAWLEQLTAEADEPSGRSAEPSDNTTAQKRRARP